MEYDVYHDESQEAGYWHGILLVPVKNRSILLSGLYDIRKNTNYNEPIAFKGIKKPSGKHFQSTRSYCSFGVCSLIQRLKRDPCGYITGKIIHSLNGMREFEYKTIKGIIGAKFIVARVVNHLKSLDESEFIDHGEKMEKTYCHALKGGLHLFGDENNSITIRSFHFDGWKQYGRHVSQEKILSCLNNLRPYCSISNEVIIDDRTSDHRESESQSEDDCQLLQLTDVLIGSFRSVLGECKNDTQRKLAVPIEQLVFRWNQGPARMKNSRWYKGYCISECLKENGEWQFRQIEGRKSNFEQFTLGMS
jgi:hypothetical protein